MSTSQQYLPDWLARCAENRPEHLAVQCEEIQWNFLELDRQATNLAKQLATIGAQPEQRIALLASNSLAYITFVHALTRLGAILVPLNTRLSREELCWQLQDVRATLLVSDASFAALAEEIGQSIPSLPVATLMLDAEHNITLSATTRISDNPQPDLSLRTLIDLSAPQAIMYTSGTTGKPKGAIITYGMHWWNAVGSALNLGLNPDDRWLACLPFFHIGGLSILIRSVIYGMSVIALPKFDPIAVNKAIIEEDVSIISVVAIMVQRMLAALEAEKRYPFTLRCVLLGGGPAPLPLLEACASRDIPIVQTYGLTESCSQAVTLAPGDALRKLGSAGRPLLPVQLRIVNEGRTALPEETGEIYLKGPTITPGYIDRPEATAQAFHDGWFATGDIGYLDKEGYLYVLDRRADLIISGGENVYPAEIEAVLTGHPAIEEAGVCGQADPQWGQVPIAFVRLRAATNASYVGTDLSRPPLIKDIQNYVSQRLARYKWPRAIYIVDQLPRTSAGKLIRRELPKLLQQ